MTMGSGPVVAGTEPGRLQAAALPLAVTMGDPGGIGGEITLKAWRRRAEIPAPFFLIDDAKRLAALAERHAPDIAIISIEQAGDAAAAFNDGLPVLSQPLARPSVAGVTDPAHNDFVCASIETAVSLVLNGLAGALVTNPINKHTLHLTGFPHPGHTEYLAALANISTPPVMMLAAPALRVVPITVHLRLTDAINSLSSEMIIEKSLIVDDALRRNFNIEHPRLGIAGLNPHAGEGGDMGDDEQTIIAPAIAALQNKGVDAFGPVPPDALFTPAMRTSYDAAICMYHDQALIPVKALYFDTAVNVTLGLPFVRTSPDHGTALDIADKGIANENSLVCALRLAADMARSRAAGI